MSMTNLRGGKSTHQRISRKTASRRTALACALHGAIGAALLASNACVIQPGEQLTGETERPPPTHATTSSTPHDAATDAGASETTQTDAAAPDTSQPAPPAPTAEMDDTSVLAAIANGRYARTRAFMKVTSTGFASAVTTGSTIQEWVSTEGYGAYTAIEPDKTGSQSHVPEGTIIVREVRDADNVVTKLTLMVKGPKGYNPALGDWWFGVTTPSGTPQTDDAGPVTGRLTQCFACHIPRANDDYLFGVLPTNRCTP